MSYVPATGASTAASMAAMTIEAIKAQGVIVTVEPDHFLAILARQEAPLVVTAQGGFFSTVYRYLTPYKGLAFFTKTKTPIELPFSAETIKARKIWVPSM